MRNMLSLCLALLAANPVGAAVDGLGIGNDFCPGGLPGCASLLELQNNHTGFGDSRPATSIEGSELDQMWVYKTVDSLGINITGNLKPTGTALVIFLDTAPGGEATLDANAGPGSVTGQEGNAFDVGFEPDYAIAMNVFIGTLYVDLVNLQENSAQYLGAIAYGTAGSLTGGGTAGTIIGTNNSNGAGVTDDDTRNAAQQQTDAATATTGLEMLISFEDLGLTSSVAEVKVMALLSDNGGFLYNQVLPGIGDGSQKSNLGGDPVDFSNVAIAPGTQYASVALVERAAVTIDGESIPAESGGAYLVATQNNFTGAGDNDPSGDPGAGGSELDALFMRNSASALEIGITGNLEPNGNRLLLFLETGPGGVADSGIAVPPSAPSPLQALNTTKLDAGFNPTHVLVLNAGSEGLDKVAWVDIFDFRTNTSRYLGKIVVGSGSGTLTGGDNPNGAELAFDNSNGLGVTGDDTKAPEQNEADAATADAGFEIVLPFADIALAQTSIEYMAVVTGSGGYLSNQLLPGLGGGYGNLAGPPVDLNLIAGLQYGSYVVTGVSFTPYADITALKVSSDGTPAEISATVSAVFPDFDHFYIQDSLPDGLTGILVAGHSDGLGIGDTVTVQGYLTRANGERTLNASSVTQGPGGVGPDAVLIGQKALGGSDISGNPGLPGRAGANNIGLLVKIWGIVTGGGFDLTTNAYVFYVDDGSGLYDGNENGWTGTRIEMPLIAGVFPDAGSYVTVTGISSVAQINNEAVPRIRVRQDSDVLIETGP